ncbi:MAG: PQQ-binding-like beta-propeller repeat protein [Bacillota bacterium]
MKKIISLLLVVVFTLSQISSAMAATVNEITEFGFDKYRNREGMVNGHIFHPIAYHDGGPSYSQPLLLDGSRWGGSLAGKTVLISVENNQLKGYILPDVPLSPPSELQYLEPVWSVKLSGSKATKSHPTFVDREGKKYIYIGTYSQYLDIVDITNFASVNQSSLTSKQNPHATDITSAPLVLNWRGHEVVVGTSGNTGKAFLMVDPTSDSATAFHINCGSGRTSSSPAPIYNGQGFAVGLDQGGSSGEVQLYHLDDILAIDTNGKVYQKGQSARVVKVTSAGLAGSFSVDGDKIFFGDSRSNIYALNWATGTPLWANNDFRGIFSNRSPALTSSNMYFPAVGETQGKLIAIDRATGKTAWVREFSSKAQTAPMVFTSASGGFGVFEGTSEGMLVGLNNNGIDIFPPFQIARPQGLSQYAQGVAGEISAAGNYCVVATEQGIVVWVLAKAFNLQAVSLKATEEPIDPEKLEPGKSYTGTATFKLDETSDYSSCIVAPVGVFLNDQYLELTDMDDKPLYKINIDGKESYVLSNIERGKEYQVKFKYTVPADGQAVLTSVIDIPYDPVMGLFMENTEEDNKIQKDLSAVLPNLLVDEFEPGVGEAVAGQKYTGWVIFCNESTIDLTDIPVAVYNNGWKINLGFDTIDLKAGETKKVTFTYTAQSLESKLKAVIDTPPLDNKYVEETEEDNVAEISVTTGEASPPSNGVLTFQARSQGGKDLYGKYIPPTNRPVNTAMWEDMVTATLKPPAPTPPKGTLKSWSITSATITIPKQHPRFSFGTPYPPVSTETLTMNPGGHTATALFKETWGIDGFNRGGSPGVYSPIEKKVMAAKPKTYTITANYTIKYTYEWQEKRRSCSTGSNGKRKCRTYYVTKSATGTTSGTATGSLLVNGAGRIPF